MNASINERYPASELACRVLNGVWKYTGILGNGFHEFIYQKSVGNLNEQGSHLPL
jgi:hypothetical protein